MRRTVFISIVCLLVTGVLWFAWVFASTSGQNQALRAELSVLRTEYEETGRALEAIKKTEAERIQARELAEKNVESLKASYQLAAANVLRLEQEKNRLGGKESGLVQAIDGLQKQKSELEKKLSQQEKEISSLRKNVSHLQSNSAAQAEKFDKEIRKRTAEFEKKLKKYDEKDAASRISIQKYEEALKSVRTSLAGLQEATRQSETYKKEAAVAHYNLGVLYMRLQQPKEAADEFERAISINPRDAFAHYNLGILYDTKLSQAGKAMSHYDTYVRLLPNAKDAKNVEYRVFQMRVQKDGGIGKDLKLER